MAPPPAPSTTQFIVTGTVDLGGADIVTPLGMYLANDTDEIVIIDGSSNVNGTFMQGNFVTDGVNSYYIDYMAGADGFDVVLTKCCDGLLDLGIANYAAASPVGNKLQVFVKPNADVINGTYSAGVFTLRTLTSNTITFTKLGGALSPFDYNQVGTATDGLYTYYFFSYAAINFVDWDANTEYLLLTLSYDCIGDAVIELTNDAFTMANNGDYYQELGGAEAQGVFYQPTVTSPTPELALELNGNTVGFGSNFAFCYDETITATFTGMVSGDAPIDLAWDVFIDGSTTPDATLSGNETGLTPVTDLFSGTLAAGSYEVVVTSFTDANGCSPSDLTPYTFSFEVNPEPELALELNGNTVGFGSNFAFCYDETITATFTGMVSGDAPIDLAWNVFIDGSATADVTLSGSQTGLTVGDNLFNSTLAAGSYVVEVTSFTDANGCSPSDLAPYTFSFVVNEEPNTSVSQNLAEICPGGAVQLTFTDNDATGNTFDIIADLVDDNGTATGGFSALGVSSGDMVTYTEGTNFVAAPGNTASLMNIVVTNTTTGCTQTLSDLMIAVEDNEAPVAICPTTAPTIVLDATGNGTLAANALAAGNSTDNCSVTETSPETTFGCGDVGTVTVVLTATDDAGNMSTANCTVTIVDNTAPTAICQDATVALDASGEGTLLASALDNGSTDNCGPLSFGILGSPAGQTYDQNVTSDVIFGSGNTNGSFTVNTDNGVELGLRAKVRFPSPANTFNSNGDGSYNHSTGAFGTGGIQAGWNFEWSINSNVSGTGQNLDQLTYEIGLDYDPSDDVDFVVFDPINLPLADHAIGDNSTSNGGGTVAADATEYATLIANNSLAQNSWRHNFFGAFDGTVDGRYEVYLKAYDMSGNVVAQTAITVIVGTGTGTTYAGSLMPLVSKDYACSDVGTITETLLVIDASGNTSTCTGDVTVEDNIAPVAICPTTAPTVILDGSGSGTLAANALADGNSTDNCSVTETSPETTFGCGDVGTVMVVLTATDDAGNMSTANCTVTIVDNTAPTAICQDATVALDASGTGTLLASALDNGSTDNCGPLSFGILGSPAGQTYDQNVTSDVIFGSGNTNGSFTVNTDNGVELGLRAKVRFPSPANTFNSNGDGSYNHSTGAFGTGGIQAGWNFEWSINSNVSGTGQNLDQLTYEIGLDYDPSDDVDFVVFDPINLPLADHAIGDNSTSNGGGTVAADATEYATLIANNSLAQNSWRHNFFGAFDGTVDGRYEVYLKAYDMSGNVVAQTAITVIVGAGTGTTYAGSLMPLVSKDYACSDVGTITETLLVIDASGNTSTCTGDVTVEDNEPPSFVGCPIDDVICVADLPYTWTNPGLTDNCDLGSTASLSYQLSGATTSGVINVSSFDGTTMESATLNPGVTTVTYTANDESGNVAAMVCSFNVTVNPNPEISYTINGTTVANVNNGTVDASENVTITVCDEEDNVNLSTITVAGGDPEAALKVTVDMVDNIAGPAPTDQDFRVDTYNSLLGTTSFPNPGSVRLADPTMPGTIVTTTQVYHDANSNGVLDPGECTGDEITVTININPKPEISYTINGTTVANVNNGTVDASENVTITVCDEDDNVTSSSITVTGGDPEAALQVTVNTVTNIAGPAPTDEDFRVVTYNGLLGSASLPNPGSVRLDDPSMPGTIVTTTQVYHDANSNGVLDAGECVGDPITVTLIINPKPEISYTINGTTVANVNNGTVDASENVTITVCDEDDNVTSSSITVTGGDPEAALQVTVNTVTNIAGPAPTDQDFRVVTFNNLLGTPALPNPGSVRLADPTMPGTIVTTTQVYHDANSNGVLDAGECVGDPITVTINVNPVPVVTFEVNGFVANASTDPNVQVCDEEDVTVTNLVLGAADNATVFNVNFAYTNVDAASFAPAGNNVLTGTQLRAAFEGVAIPLSLTDDTNEGSLVVTLTPYYDVNSNDQIDSGECAGDPITVTINVDPVPVVTFNVNTLAADASTDPEVQVCDEEDVTVTNLMLGAADDETVFNVNFTYTNVDVASFAPAGDNVLTGTALRAAFENVAIPLSLTDDTNEGSLVVTLTPYYDADGDDQIDAGECAGAPVTVTINVDPVPVVTFDVNGLAANASTDPNVQVVDEEAVTVTNLLLGAADDETVFNVNFNYTNVDAASFAPAGNNTLTGTALRAAFEGVAIPISLIDNTNIGSLVVTLTPYYDVDGDGQIDTGECNGAPVTVTINVEPLSVLVEAKVFLQGAYDSFTGLMRDDLRAAGLLPTTEPFSAINTAYPGAFVSVNNSVTETVAPAVLAAAGNDAIVDWVWLELRDAADLNTVVATRSALVRRDGDIVDLDGVSAVEFPDTYVGAYYLLVRHRNHLGAMTANPVDFTTVMPLDFTVAAEPTFGTTPTSARRLVKTGVYGLWAGNTKPYPNSAAGFNVKYNGGDNDRLPILGAVGTMTPLNIVPNTYQLEDVNMDGQVKYNGSKNDRVIILQNVGIANPLNIITQEPNN